MMPRHNSINNSRSSSRNLIQISASSIHKRKARKKASMEGLLHHLNNIKICQAMMIVPVNSSWSNCFKHYIEQTLKVINFNLISSVIQIHSWAINSSNMEQLVIILTKDWTKVEDIKIIKSKLKLTYRNWVISTRISTLSRKQIQQVSIAVEMWHKILWNKTIV